MSDIKISRKKDSLSARLVAWQPPAAPDVVDAVVARMRNTVDASIPPWDFSPGPSATPLGLEMCQNRAAIPTWSYAMERHPPARIIEIGTYSGGFITALAVHAWCIGARVVSYDVNRPKESILPLAKFLGVEFRRGSCWDFEAVIAALIREPGLTYVLCDGGDKPRELATFARYLKPGDVIAAHDYISEQSLADADRHATRLPWVCSEITRAHVERAVTEHTLKPWYQEHFDLAAWLVYRKEPKEI